MNKTRYWESPFGETYTSPPFAISFCGPTRKQQSYGAVQPNWYETFDHVKMKKADYEAWLREKRNSILAENKAQKSVPWRKRLRNVISNIFSCLSFP